MRETNVARTPKPSAGPVTKYSPRGDDRLACNSAILSCNSAILFRYSAPFQPTHAPLRPCLPHLAPNQNAVLKRALHQYKSEP